MHCRFLTHPFGGCAECNSAHPASMLPWRLMRGDGPGRGRGVPEPCDPLTSSLGRGVVKCTRANTKPLNDDTHTHTQMKGVSRRGARSTHGSIVLGRVREVRPRAGHTHTHTHMKGVSEPRIRFFAGKHVGCAPFAHLLGWKRALTSILYKNTRF